MGDDEVTGRGTWGRLPQDSDPSSPSLLVPPGPSWLLLAPVSSFFCFLVLVIYPLLVLVPSVPFFKFPLEATTDLSQVNSLPDLIN